LGWAHSHALIRMFTRLESTQAGGGVVGDDHAVVVDRLWG